MSDVTQEPETQPVEPTSGRNLFIFMGGMTFLGVALALILFGGELFGSLQTEPAAVAESPSFELQTPVVAGIETGLGNVQIGEIAPDFGLATLDGEGVKLSDYKGQPVILNFWATWCAPCRVEMPELEDAYQANKDDGLVILALNREEAPEVVQEYFVDEMGLSFTALLDETGAVAESYGVFNMPTTYFVNPEGEVTVIHRGPMNRELIEEYLAQTVP